MSIDFPNSPALNDTHVVGSKTFIWNGKGWVLDASAATNDLLDEDDMISNSDTKAPTQQSFKAYVDNFTEGANLLSAIDGIIGHSGWQTSMQGYTGSQGYQGSVGVQGALGITGFQGSQGFTGSRGIVGFQGSSSTGAVGFQGSQGNLGFVGSQGFTGSQGLGPTGLRGSTGPTGDAATTAFTGSRGVTGFSGSDGVAVGFTGSRGATGFTGSGTEKFIYGTTSGAAQDLDLATASFFNGGTINSNITLTFSNVPAEASWHWTGTISAAAISTPYTITLPASVGNISSVDISTLPSVSANQQLTLRFVTGNSGTDVLVVSRKNV